MQSKTIPLTPKQISHAAFVAHSNGAEHQERFRRVELQPPSKTYLFDNQRTGRALYELGARPSPQVCWRFRLRSHPAYAPESTAVFDASGNLYFGAHDGCFYSITADGVLRWMFRTSRKIYSSPAIHGERVVFHCGDGRLYCLDLNTGLPEWIHEPRIEKKSQGWWRRLLVLWNVLQYDYSWHQRLGMKSWSSPVVDERRGVVYSVTRERGLLAIDLKNGGLLWSRTLGFPWNYLAGPSLDAHGNIYVCAQRRWVFSFDPNGGLRWRVDTTLNLDLWGSPAIDLQAGVIYITGGLGRERGGVAAITIEGKRRWSRSAPGAIRGGASLTRDGQLAVACLNGKVALLQQSDGAVERVISTSTSSRWLNWTTPAVMPDGRLLVATVDSRSEGGLICLNRTLDTVWSIKLGKSHAVPVTDANGRVYASSWKGELVCMQT